MPSLSFTPGLYRFTGGTGFFNGLDYTPYVASFTGGNVSLGVSLETGLLGEDVKLDRHSRGDAIVDKDGSPSMREQIREQRNLEAIEAAFRNQQAQIDTLEVIVAQLQAVINAQAQTAAQVASVEADIALANSKTVPVDGLLSATSDGVINISAHDRDYADGSAPVAVDAGSISGFTEGQFVRVYYLDAAREGGAVSYIGTIDEVTQTGTIHVVGGVTIPMIGDPPSTGTGTTPPGYVRTLPE